MCVSFIDRLHGLDDFKRDFTEKLEGMFFLTHLGTLKVKLPMVKNFLKIVYSYKCIYLFGCDFPPLLSHKNIIDRL